MFFISTTLLFRYSMTGALFELDGAAGGRALGRGVAELEGLFDLQVGQALDLQDAAGEDVLLALPWPPSAGPAWMA
jgi:hypothetical protein